MDKIRLVELAKKSVTTEGLISPWKMNQLKLPQEEFEELVGYLKGWDRPKQKL